MLNNDEVLIKLRGLCLSEDVGSGQQHTSVPGPRKTTKNFDRFGVKLSFI